MNAQQIGDEDKDYYDPEDEALGASLWPAGAARTPKLLPGRDPEKVELRRMMHRLLTLEERILAKAG